jgi:DNA repair exonuclease SbcCD nuclease subunit
MTRILVTSDWHVDAVTAGVSRYVEIGQLVEQIISIIKKEKVDHFFHLGDVFDPGSSSEAVWSSFIISSALAIQDALRGRSLWIAGNHDVLERREIMTVLSPLRHAMRDNHRIRVSEKPELVDFGDIQILTLPFVARSADSATMIDDAISASRGRTELVVVGHLSIPGITPGSEEEMLRGRDIIFPAEKVASLSPRIVLNGHYHRPQVVTYRGLDIRIVGAPARMTFGEIDPDPRGFLVVDL